MLTKEQKAHFDAFGFLRLPQLFSTEEIEAVRQASIDVITQYEGANTLDSDEGWSIGGFMERHPLLITLLDDDRIHGIPETLLGPDFILHQTEGRSRAGNTSWHGPVPAEHELRTVKINFYLDKLTKETGALRFVPGSHEPSNPDLYEELRANNDDPEFRPFGLKPSEIPCFAAESNPGDLVVFTEHTLHSSFGGSLDRQQHAINFMENPRSDDQVTYIKNLYESWKYGLRPAESYINSDRPRIRRMVSRLVEWGFETSKV